MVDPTLSSVVNDVPIPVTAEVEAATEIVPVRALVRFPWISS